MSRQTTIINHISFKGLALALATLLLYPACSTPAAEESREERFAAAIIDAARELTPEDIYDKLVAIEYGASQLTEWKIEESDTMLLVASLQPKGWSYTATGADHRFTTSDSADAAIWVTIPNELNAKLLAEPEMRDSTTLNNRLLEIIGLRPDGTESIINLLWIDPHDLLRPSYDPDPTTTHGAVEYPADNQLPTWYKEWFEGNIAYSYLAPAEGLNYPFTRLGYTYDWGEGASKYGLSEFITLPQSEVCIERSIGCWEYYKSLQ